MKKIVSLVLALVLVLAIAAPAMAITGYERPVAPSTGVMPFGGGISLVDSSAAGLGVLGLNAIATNKAYIVNEVVYGRVNINYNPNTTYNRYDTSATNLILSSDAANLVSAVLYKVTSPSSSDLLLGWGSGSVEMVAQQGVNAYNTITLALPDWASYVALFSGVVHKAGTVTATLRGGNPEAFDTFANMSIAEAASWLGVGNMVIYDDLGVRQYDVGLNGNDVVVSVYNAAGTAVIGQVAFARTPANICTAIWVQANTVAGGGYNFQKSQPISTGVVVDSFTAMDGTVYTNADTGAAKLNYDALRAIYDEVMAFFGFDYDAAGLLLDGHFVQKLHSFNVSDSATINLYTQAITVPDPDVEIPQTGDAATTIGFVMVAMAIVAAAAVAYKKVRA